MTPDEVLVTVTFSVKRVVPNSTEKRTNGPSFTRTSEVTSTAPHAPAPSVTVKVWPAIVTVPVRGPPEFAPALTTTAPLPAADPPEVTVIHAALLLAVHAQPAGAVTTALALPPVSLSAATAGLIA